MKKSESLVATLLVIYAILLTISVALYAVIREFSIDIALSTNLLIWTATIFAPIAVLMTYTSWKEQKNSENMSRYSEEIYIGFVEYFSILESYPLIFENREEAVIRTEELDSHFRKMSLLIVVYFRFLKYIKEEDKIFDFQKLENHHLKLILVMEILNKNLDEIVWYKSVNDFVVIRDQVMNQLKKISNDLAEKFMYLSE